MAVSVKSAWAGNADLAVGNVVGSNIFNVLLILGVSALITPLVVAQDLVKRDVPLMIVLSLATLLVALDGSIARVEGLLLLGCLVAYTVWCVRASRRESLAVADEYAAEFAAPPMRTWPIDVLLVVGGLALLVVGARFLVDGAVAVAEWLGASKSVIGLTIVAAGTSLPEVATSVLASIRGQRDIAVGNVIGSNLFNLTGVLGLSAAVAPGAGLPVAESMLAFDLPVMVAVAVACLPVFFTGHRIARWEGLLFLAYYVAYTAFLVLQATRHDALEGFAWVMVWFALPLTAATLAVFTWRTWRR
jgi:cation:H+ antiporter